MIPIEASIKVFHSWNRDLENAQAIER